MEIYDDLRAISVKEAAQRLDLNIVTIRRLICSGELHAIKVGSRWRVPLPSIIAFFAGQEYHRFSKREKARPPEAYQ
jgi:excisionase family DNA binding protein